MAKYSYTAIVHDDGPKGFYLEVPEVVGLEVRAGTLEELKKLAEDGLAFWIRHYTEARIPIPQQGRIGIVQIETEVEDIEDNIPKEMLDEVKD